MFGVWICYKTESPQILNPREAKVSWKKVTPQPQKAVRESCHVQGSSVWGAGSQVLGGVWGTAASMCERVFVLYWEVFSNLIIW